MSSMYADAALLMAVGCEVKVIKVLAASYLTDGEEACNREMMA